MDIEEYWANQRKSMKPGEVRRELARLANKDRRYLCKVVHQAAQHRIAQGAKA